MLILLKIKINHSVFPMDIVNNSFVSAIYKKFSIASSHGVEKKSQHLLESVFHYEKTEMERHAMQCLFNILDQKSDEKYRQLVNKLQKGSYTQVTNIHSKSLNLVNVTASVSSTEVTATEDTVTEDPYYNAVKQKWAQGLLEKIQSVMTNVLTAANSDSSEDKTDLDTISTEINRLVSAGMQLTEADFTSLYGLPEEFFNAIQKTDIFTGAQKTTFVNELAGCYGEATQLIQVFADSRIEGFQDVLNVVKSLLTTEQFTDFLPLETKLNELRTTVQPYDDDELNQIAQVGDDLSLAIAESDLPRNDKIPLTNQLSLLYQDQVEALKSFNVVLSAVDFVNQHQSSVFSTISSLVESLMGTFAPINLGQSNTEISSAALSGALQIVRAINSRFDELTEEQQTLVNTAVDTLDDFYGNQYLGGLWAYFVASTALANNPTATLTDVNNAVKEAAKEVENSKFNFAKSLKEVMDAVANANGKCTINNNPSEIYTIYSSSTDNADNTVTTNQILLNRGSVGFLPKITAAANGKSETTARAYFQFKGQASVEDAKLQQTTEEVQTQKQGFQSMQTNIYAEQLMSQAVGLKSMALPSAVATVLIDHYMPKEVDFLEEIYGQLYYSNFGSSVGNAVIDAISQYVNAATYFTFASYVGQQPAVGVGSSSDSSDSNVFPGSAESAQSKLDTEKQQAAAYLKSTQDALTVIAEQVAKVNADEKMTNEQRTNILDALNDYTDNLNAISSSLVLLQNYLAPLSVAEGTVAGTFKVNGGQEQWQSRLEILEDALISGLSGNAVAGGMFPVQALVQADQQSYADMGQNYQLELQMHLTSMQQEWTVVATSLQLLNQMYLSLARSLVG
ncbi:effector from type III secretion system family protein [Chlamydia avium]|uniref:Effector from type III secretion system family protein n=2 Tax=Chlamydia avium TaxID=1457141 RepID=A0ABN0MSV5_9CHLA|nr:effector from type III secretion system family protein [Chlamydia psittaci 10_743_SC13]EPP38582.1 effector from type III secretion system family protein [Chlamydia avium]